MDREIVARGTTLPQTFSEAALAVFAFAADPGSVRPLEVREVRAHGATLAALFAHWIAECCYVHEIEGFVCHAIDFALFDIAPKAGGEPLRLHAFLRGEERDGTDRLPRVIPARDLTLMAGAPGYEVRLRIVG